MPVRRSVTSRNRVIGVSVALAWDTKASGSMKRFLDSSTSQPEASTGQPNSPQ